MAQCFISTYRNHYRWCTDIERRKLALPFDPFLDIPLPPDNILDPHLVASSLDHPSDLEELNALISRLYKRTTWTTYQRHFCKDMIQKARKTDDTEELSFESALMESGKKLFDPEGITMVPAPQQLARRLYGYIAPYRLNTPLTTYQRDIGKNGYNLLKGNPKPKQTVQKEAETLNKVAEKKRSVSTRKKLTDLGCSRKLDAQNKQPMFTCLCCCSLEEPE